MLQNGLEIWEMYCTLSILALMKAVGLPTPPLASSCHSSLSGEKAEAPKHVGRNMILTPGFTPQCAPYFSKGCFTPLAYPSVQFMWQRMQRGGKRCDVRKGLFLSKHEGGVIWAKQFAAVVQGCCWLGAEVTHTPIIHTSQKHRTWSPVLFAAAAATTLRGLKHCPVFQGWHPTKLAGSREERDVCWETAKENGLKKLSEGI